MSPHFYPNKYYSDFIQILYQKQNNILHSYSAETNISF